ncbi:MAG: glycoside hydrolase family 3 protein [Chloroflexota bacterium]
MRRLAFRLASLASLFVLLAGGQGAAITYANPSPDSQVNALMQNMTLDQRVGQLFMVSLYGEELSTTGQNFLRDMQPGAVAMFSYNGTSPQAINQTINAWQKVSTQTGAQIPLLVAIDQEGGTVIRLTDGFTQLPWGGALAAMPSDDAQTVGKIAGQELSAVGINMNLAPVVDVRTLPDNFFMERRMMGSDPAAIGAAASAYIKGMRENGVIGVLKHFPGHGAAGDSHTMLPVVNYDLDHVNTVELTPFRVGIENGAEAIMVGHLVYPALDPTPGLPASLSPKIVGDVLRKQLGFQGVAITDAMDMAAIVDHFTRPVAAVMAIRAGIDMIATGPHTPIAEQQAMKQAILDAVQRGDLPEARINEAVQRILMLKAKHGLLAWAALNPVDAVQRVDIIAHQPMIEQIYLDTISIVHDPLHYLPLTPGARKVAVIYPGIFPSLLRSCSDIDTPAAVLSYTLAPTLTEQAAARSVSQKADVTLIFTYDIDDYPAQAYMVNNVPANKTIVIALQSPYDLQHGIQPSTYVAAFNAYPSAFKAVCAVLYGNHPAVGKWQP